jgi:hypothetical protein
MESEKSSKIRTFWAIILIGALVSGGIFFSFATSAPQTEEESNIDAFGKILRNELVQPETTTIELAGAHTAPPTNTPTPTPRPTPKPTPTLPVGGPKPTISTYPTPKPSADYNEPIYTQSAVQLRKELWPICSCETSYIGTKYGIARHFENGHVIRGYNSPEDIGMCQISLTWHGARAEQLGYDLFDEADNIRYANYLYSVEGSTPWFRSEFCWMKP